MVGVVEPNHLKGEVSFLKLDISPKLTGRSICLRGRACFLGTMLWKGASLGGAGTG
jgi:hypothetical protein